MADDLIPGRRGRKAPMPVLEQTVGESREALSEWMKSRFEEMEHNYKTRIERLRNGGEHPSPVFQKQIRLFAALGIEPKLIARMCFITKHILETYYEEDLELGKAEAMVPIAANMMRIATSLNDPNNAKVGMEWLNRRGGEEWKPPAQKLELSKKDNGPPVIDPSNLTAEERAQLRQMMNRVLAGGTGDPIDPDEEDPVIEG